MRGSLNRGRLTNPYEGRSSCRAAAASWATIDKQLNIINTYTLINLDASADLIKHVYIHKEIAVVYTICK